jgi:hypothetical protein
MLIISNKLYSVVRYVVNRRGESTKILKQTSNDYVVLGFGAV